MSCEGARLDKWLWHARFAKTRAQGQRLIAGGQVGLNGAVARKAGVRVHPGDTISVILGPVRRTVIVRRTGERRGPAAEARALYDEPNVPARLSWDEASIPPHRL